MKRNSFSMEGSIDRPPGIILWPLQCFVLIRQSDSPRWWSDTNPRFRFETQPLNDPGIMVWGGMWGENVIGPYFFYSHVTGATFKNLIENQILPDLRKLPGFDRFLLWSSQCFVLIRQSNSPDQYSKWMEPHHISIMM